MQAGSEAAEALYDGDEAAIKAIARARQLLEKIACLLAGTSRRSARTWIRPQVMIKEVAETLQGFPGPDRS